MARVSRPRLPAVETACPGSPSWTLPNRFRRAHVSESSRAGPAGARVSLYRNNSIEIAGGGTV